MLPHCLARNTLMQAWCIGNVQAVGYLGSALHCQHHTISSAPSLAVGDREYYGAPARRASERAKLSNDFDEGAEGVGRPDSERRASVIAMAGRTLDPAGDAAWLRARATSA